MNHELFQLFFGFAQGGAVQPEQVGALQLHRLNLRQALPNKGNGQLVVGVDGLDHLFHPGPALGVGHPAGLQAQGGGAVVPGNLLEALAVLLVGNDDVRGLHGGQVEGFAGGGAHNNAVLRGHGGDNCVAVAGHDDVEMNFVADDAHLMLAADTGDLL